MIEIAITEEQIEKAKHKAKNLGILRNSVESGKGNFVGFLGEIVVADYYGWKEENTYDYDVLFKHHKIDVKTKRRTVKPRLDYFATVFDYNTKQKCDYYFFVSVYNESLAHLMGIIKKQKFYEIASFHQKGDYDITSPPNKPFYFKAPCYNLKYSQLFQAEKIVKYERANL